MVQVGLRGGLDCPHCFTWLVRCGSQIELRLFLRLLVADFRLIGFSAPIMPLPLLLAPCLQKEIRTHTNSKQTSATCCLLYRFTKATAYHCRLQLPPVPRTRWASELLGGQGAISTATLQKQVWLSCLQESGGDCSAVSSQPHGSIEEWL